MDKIELTGVVLPETEDGGMAKIAHIAGDDDGFFVRLQSWSKTKEHPVMESLKGHRVRITIEPLEDVASTLFDRKIALEERIKSIHRAIFQRLSANYKTDDLADERFKLQRELNEVQARLTEAIGD